MPTCLQAGKAEGFSAAISLFLHISCGGIWKARPLGLYVRLDPFIHWTNICWVLAGAKPSTGAKDGVVEKNGQRFLWTLTWPQIDLRLLSCSLWFVCVYKIYKCVFLDFTFRFLRLIYIYASLSIYECLYINNIQVKIYNHIFLYSLFQEGKGWTYPVM